MGPQTTCGERPRWGQRICVVYRGIRWWGSGYGLPETEGQGHLLWTNGAHAVSLRYTGMSDSEHTLMYSVLSSWRHDMETVSISLALYEANPLDSPNKWPVMWAFDVLSFRQITNWRVMDLFRGIVFISKAHVQSPKLCVIWKPGCI